MEESFPEMNAEALAATAAAAGTGTVLPQLPHKQHPLRLYARDPIAPADMEQLGLTSAALISRAYGELDSTEGDGAENDLLSPADAAQELLTYGFAKFCSAAVVNPIQVAGTLLQVQYLPSDRWLDAEKAKIRGECSLGSDPPRDAHDEGLSDQDRPVEEDVEDSDLDLAEDMYASENLRYYAGTSESLSPTASTDHLGYVVPTDADVEDDALRPMYQLPPLEHGVWNAMTAVIKNPFEGWTSLWKGNFTFWLQQMLDIIIQPNMEMLIGRPLGYPTIEEEYTDLLYTDSVRLNITSHLASRVLVGWLLSPLDLVRTRLIVQSSHPKYCKYHGTYDCLRTTIREEGGLRSLFFDQSLLVPTVVLHTASTLLDVTRPLLLYGLLGLRPDRSPLLHALSDLAFSTLELLVTLPLETCRKRLQVQSSRVRVQEGRTFAPCVQLRRRQYSGLRDCLRRIVEEEGGQRERPVAGRSARRRRRGIKEGSMGLLGWKRYRGLFKGASVKIGAKVTMFVINLFGQSTVEEDW